MKHLENQVREIFEANKLKALVDREIDNVEEFLKEAELIYVCVTKSIKHRTEEVFQEEMVEMDYQISKDSIRGLTIVIIFGRYFILDGYTILKDGFQHELDFYEEVSNVEEFAHAVTDNPYISENKIEMVQEEVRKGTDGRDMHYLLIEKFSIGIAI
ncbi:hypothetical protein COA01_23230 [Bacillus cereus]|uniref:hypothetical protein n=1 Tax=Bacillus cereus TaxID=1396 RepID=UPI000BFDF882|nr:hypothetical protein [Bacillus cereus]PGP18658.1 hypothetical protein COA01_23230 [Bacillus cereus]